MFTSYCTHTPNLEKVYAVDAATGMRSDVNQAAFVFVVAYKIELTVAQANIVDAE